MIPEQATWIRFPRFVGDAVMQFPILRLLRQVADTPLVVWGPALTVALVEGTDLADAVLPEDGKLTVWVLSRILKQYQPLRTVSFPKSMRPACAAFLAGVPERLGVSESLAGFFHTHSRPFWKEPGHFLDRYARVLALRWPELGPLPYANYRPVVAVDLPEHPYLALLPGASNPAKSWEPAYFKALRRMAQHHGIEVVVLGSSSERELAAYVAGRKALNLAGQTDLPRAAAWLAHATVVVGNDSGLSHLAAACGTRTLSLFGATDPAASAPWGPGAEVITGPPLPCRPCMKKTCPISGHPCLAGVAPETVWEKIRIGLP